MSGSDAMGPVGARWRVRTAALVLCALFVAGAAASIRWGDPLERLVGTARLARPLRDAVPVRLEGWDGRDEPLTETEMRAILADDYVRRLYRNAQGEAVTLFVSFHGNRERGLQRYYHNPTVCYPAAGWSLAATRFETITLRDAGLEVPTCRYVFDKGGAKLSVTTVFKVDDEFLDESPRNKPFWMLIDRLQPDLDDRPGSFVQVQVIVPVTDGDESKAAGLSSRFLQQFGRTLLSAVQPGSGT
ncbi:MAG: EpsI family protein [Planctomycetes bacterium]|nr:EpsI family protein [Planctomycetota bacterium]